MCVCYIHVYIGMCSYRCIFLHAWVFVKTCHLLNLSVCVCVCMCVCKQMSKHVSMCAYNQVNIYICIYIYTDVYIYIFSATEKKKDVHAGIDIVVVMYVQEL